MGRRSRSPSKSTGGRSGRARRARPAPTSSRCSRRPAAATCGFTAARGRHAARPRRGHPRGPRPAAGHAPDAPDWPRRDHPARPPRSRLHADGLRPGRDAISQTEDAARWPSAARPTTAMGPSGEATAADVRAMAGIGAGDDVLEIGSAPAVSAASWPVCRHWTGGDVSPNAALRGAGARRSAQRVDRPLNGYDLTGIPDRSLDVVYCTGVFMHLDEWDASATCWTQGGFSRPGGASTSTTSTCWSRKGGRSSWSTSGGSVEAAGQRQPALDAPGAGALPGAGRL